MASVVLATDALKKASCLKALETDRAADGLSVMQTELSKVIKKMKWEDGNIDFSSACVISALQAVYKDFVEDKKVCKACSKLQHCFGSEFVDLWKLDGILKTLTNLN